MRHLRLPLVLRLLAASALTLSSCSGGDTRSRSSQLDAGGGTDAVVSGTPTADGAAKAARGGAGAGGEPGTGGEQASSGGRPGADAGARDGGGPGTGVSVDHVFAAAGVLVTDLQAHTSRAHHVIALGPDGTLLVAGDRPLAQGGSTAALERYDALGKPDATFGGGTVVLPLPPAYARYSPSAIAVATAPDGSAYVLASLVGATSATLVTHVLATGALDGAFGAGGSVALAEVPVPTDLVVQRDGRAIVAGTTIDPSNRDMVAVRLTPAGAPDTTFAAGQVGFTSPTAGPFDDECDAMVLQDDGKLVLLGASNTTRYPSHSLGAARLGTDGALDATYGNGGRSIYPVDVDPYLTAAIALPGGAVLEAGSGRTRSFAFVRDPSGAQDSTYGAQGEVVLALSPPRALARFGDGRVLALGEDFVPPHAPLLVRVTAMGAIDPAFGAPFRFDPTSDAHGAAAVLAQPDGKALVAIVTGTGLDNTLVVGRLVLPP
jgi:uncharacterized delta-60 repeat protein